MYFLAYQLLLFERREVESMRISNLTLGVLSRRKHGVFSLWDRRRVVHIGPTDGLGTPHFTATILLP